MRYRLRTLLIAVTSFLIGLGVTLAVDRAYHAGLWKETRQLRAPAEMITWLFILGDFGTNEQHRFWTLTSGTAFYACVVFCFAQAVLLCLKYARIP